MKMIIYVICFCILVSLLASCATPYQRKGFRGGYADEHLHDNVYIVTFNGNGFTDWTTATKYAHRRAAELCKENGYDSYRDLGGRRSVGAYTTVGGVHPEVILKIECIK